jgi:exonuclease III
MHQKQTQIEERRIKRNFKQREARKKHRIEGQVNKKNSASAQEPHKKIKIELGKEIHIATLNIRGANKLGKREEVEDWTTADNISILALQETKSPHSKRGTTKDYIWYFSGNGQDKCHHGVGIVIRKDAAKHIEDIEPSSERLMYITIDGVIPINITVTYVPIAINPIDIKDKTYENLQNNYDKLKNKGPTHMVGDFNSR